MRTDADDFKSFEIMNTYDYTGLDMYDISNRNLPRLIEEQINKLKALDRSINEAMMAAEKATESARSADAMSAGWGKKKAAIEELQSSVVDLADAIQAGVEAQQLSFEHHTKITEITKYLFGLGVSNIATNRFVVRELEMRLKGASQEELSELARQELMMVVKQLKDQEDILKKQEDFSRAVKVLNEKIKKLDEEIEAQTELSKQHEKQLKMHAETDKRLDERLQAQEELNKQHEKQLKLHTEANKRLDERLQTQEEMSKQHEKQLKIHTEADKRLDLRLQEQEEMSKQHEKQLKIHAESDKRLEEKLLEQMETDRLHDEQFRIHSESLAKLDEMILSLQEKSNKLMEQLNDNEIVIESQKKLIDELTYELEKQQELLNTKANGRLGFVTLGIAAVAFILSVLHFII